jgi:hypothetical protein
MSIIRQDIPGVQQEIGTNIGSSREGILVIPEGQPNEEEVRPIS